MKICRIYTNYTDVCVNNLTSTCPTDALIVEWSDTQTLMHEEQTTKHIQLICRGKVNVEISKLLKKEKIEHEKKYLGKKCWKFLMKDIHLSLDKLISKLERIEIKRYSILPM